MPSQQSWTKLCTGFACNFCSTHFCFSHAGDTRTCIHTPGAAYSPHDLTPDAITEILDQAVLVYFDGRLTEAALKLAKAARAQQVPVIVEAERLRPTLEQLLQQADYVSTSAHFPQVKLGMAFSSAHFPQRIPNSLFISQQFRHDFGICDWGMSSPWHTALLVGQGCLANQMSMVINTFSTRQSGDLELDYISTTAYFLQATLRIFVWTMCPPQNAAQR